MGSGSAYGKNDLPRRLCVGLRNLAANYKRRCVKTPVLIGMSFGIGTRLDPRNIVLTGCPRGLSDLPRGRAIGYTLLRRGGPSQQWWLGSLVAREFDLRLDGREFDSRPTRLVPGWVTVFGISPSHLGQLSLLPFTGREMSTGQSAVMLCGWGVKAGWLIPCG